MTRSSGVDQYTVEQIRECPTTGDIHHTEITVDHESETAYWVCPSCGHDHHLERNEL